MQEENKSDVVDESSQMKSVDQIDTLHTLFRSMFSKEFIESNEYLKSHMNSSMSIPIEAVAEAPEVKGITTDLDIVRRALDTSNSVIVIDECVRPNIKAEQHTIILRDVDSNVTEVDVLKVFADVACPPVVGCKSEMNSTWFVTFATEADARVALINIRNSKLGGQPVKARLKTEYTTKSFYTYVRAI